jgi:hypothetical protein
MLKMRSTPSMPPCWMTSCAPPGNDFFGRLEDQTHGRPLCRQGVEVPLERQTRTEDCGRVEVMTAGVGDPVTLRGERQVGSFGHRQGVQVRPQPHAVCRVDRPEVRHQSAAGKQPHPDPGGPQPVRDEGGGADLASPQLGVRMDVAAERDELALQLGQRLAQDDRGRREVTLRFHER